MECEYCNKKFVNRINEEKRIITADEFIKKYDWKKSSIDTINKITANKEKLTAEFLYASH